MTKNTDKNLCIKKRYSFFAIAIFFIIILSWVFCLNFGYVLVKNGTGEEWGQFGDFFGSINALFSGLALAGVVVSLFYQREDLRLQREELADTRKELEGQKEALERQNAIWEKQNFDSLFFSLFKTHNDIKNNLYSVRDKGKIAQGTASFNHFATLLENKINTFHNDYDSCMKEINRRLLTKFSFESYCKSLQQLFLTVDTIAPDSIDRQFYLRMVIDTITEQEQLVLFIYGWRRDFKKLKKYIEHYSLLNKALAHPSVDIAMLRHDKKFDMVAFSSTKLPASLFEYILEERKSPAA